MSQTRVHLQFGCPGHEDEWVVAVDGYGHRLGQEYLPQWACTELQEALGDGYTVSNRGSRLEITHADFLGPDRDRHEGIVHEATGVMAAQLLGSWPENLAQVVHP